MLTRLVHAATDFRMHQWAAPMKRATSRVALCVMGLSLPIVHSSVLAAAQFAHAKHGSEQAQRDNTPFIEGRHGCGTTTGHRRSCWLNRNGHLRWVAQTLCIADLVGKHVITGKAGLGCVRDRSIWVHRGSAIRWVSDHGCFAGVNGCIGCRIVARYIDFDGRVWRRISSIIIGLDERN